VDAKRVHELRGRGLKNTEIAAALGVSVRSVIRAAKQPTGSRQVA
jgi:DNA-binding NarL/FixJ family response regulator